MAPPDASQRRASSGKGAVTELLAEWHHGDADALGRVIPLMYEELKRVARAHLRRERPGQLLQTTALVHEAYVRLARFNRISALGRTHFLALAARLMRQILVDQARRNRAGKRGAGATIVSLEGVSMTTPRHSVDVLAVDEALSRLAVEDPQQARIVELRFFGGLTADEAADALGVSVSSVNRDWSMARAWLFSQLRP